jgi:hypothetical protein
VRSRGSVHLGACVGALSRGAACGRAIFNAVYEREILQQLDSVRVELCKDAGRVESCFGDEFVRRVSAEGEKRGETCDDG